MDVFDARVCELGEGPFYDDRTGRAGWVDVPGHRVLWRDLSTGATGEWATPGDVGAAVPRREGGLALLLADGPALADATGMIESRIDHPGVGAAVPVRCNDAKADPAGRLWFGTMAYDMSPGAGRLYRLDPVDGATPVTVLEVSVSNGLGWSPDGARMYYIDTPTHRVDVFDYDLASGAVEGRRTFVDVAPGRPDGLCVDAEGGVWVALWGSGSVRRYTPDGELEREVTVPTPYTTSCAFVGADLDLLIITTAAVRRAAGTPEGGLTYAYRPGDVVGRPADRYAG
jgi:sugar lactone lactonase YvrE